MFFEIFYNLDKFWCRSRIAYVTTKKYFVEFKNGDSKAPLKQIGKSKNSGTKITFLPSKEIFSSTKFSSVIIQKRMRELAFLNKGVNLAVLDKTLKKEKKVAKSKTYMRKKCII